MEGSLFVVTNRAAEKDSRTGSFELGERLNPKGAKELRLFEAQPKDDSLREWHLDEIPDRVTARDFDNAGVTPFTLAKPEYVGSDLVAARIVQRLRKDNRNLLVFIHGYNNNATDAFRRAWRLARRYDLEVLVFTWPANGGGERFMEDFHGVASYKSDKSDARSSTEALDRALGRMQMLLKELNEEVLPEAREQARTAHPDSLSDRREMLVRLLRERGCPFRVSLLAHSMGNYLYKKMLLTSCERLSLDTVFDNVILKAADANHAEHKEWVERIRARHRVYITINQNDDALQVSTMKVGEEQKPRLGNTLIQQNAANATYVDFTLFVGDKHSYFDEADLGMTRQQSKPLTAFFENALNGRPAELGLPYNAGTNTYRLE